MLARWKDTSGSGRVVFQAIVVQDIVGRPASGLLFGNGRMDVRRLLGDTYGMEIYSHNDYLDIMAGYGMLGLAPFVWELSALAYLCFRRSKSSVLRVECCAGVVIWMVAMLTEGVLSDDLSTLLLGAMVGTMIAYRRHSRVPYLSRTR